MRIEVEVLQDLPEYNMKQGDRKNLQPGIARRLSKKGLVKEIGTKQSPNHSKRFVNAMKVEVTKYEL